MARVRIDPAGWPFIGGALALALVSGALVTWALSTPFIVVAAFCLFFFRDPERRIAGTPDSILSPADGRVLVAGPAEAIDRAAGVTLTVWRRSAPASS